jgi:U3 small nucleolar RNA-associated protein 22
MSPLPAKRRKLNHNATPVDSSLSEANEQHSPPLASNEILASPKPTKATRASDGGDAVLYAGGAYKSSMFKLQVDELLREVVPNYEKRFSGVTETLHKLKGLIEEIAEREALSVR